MGKIPSDNTSLIMSCTRDSRDIKELPSVVVDTAEHDQCKTFSFALDRIENILGSQVIFAIARLLDDQALVRIKSVESDLLSEGI